MNFVHNDSPTEEATEKAPTPLQYVYRNSKLDMMRTNSPTEKAPTPPEYAPIAAVEVPNRYTNDVEMLSNDPTEKAPIPPGHAPPIASAEVTNHYSNDMEMLSHDSAQKIPTPPGDAQISPQIQIVGATPPKKTPTEKVAFENSVVPSPQEANTSLRIPIEKANGPLPDMPFQPEDFPALPAKDAAPVIPTHKERREVIDVARWTAAKKLKFWTNKDLQIYDDFKQHFSQDKQLGVGGRM